MNILGLGRAELMVFVNTIYHVSIGTAQTNNPHCFLTHGVKTAHCSSTARLLSRLEHCQQLLDAMHWWKTVLDFLPAAASSQ